MCVFVISVCVCGVHSVMCGVCVLIIFQSCLVFVIFFFFKQKTAYEMRISDWSSDVCSSDLGTPIIGVPVPTENGCSPHTCTVVPRHSSTGSKIGRASCRERVCQYV